MSAALVQNAVFLIFTPEVSQSSIVPLSFENRMNKENAEVIEGQGADIGANYGHPWFTP